MSITIKELADLANTSTATVSRVLSNKPGVTDARRNKILDLAKRLGYSPNRIARSLATQRTHSLGFIAADLANPVYIDFLHQTQTILEEKGYSVLVADSKREVEKERANVELMREHCVDGMIIFPVHDWNSDTDVDHLLTLKLANFPFILIGKVEGFGFDWVTTEEIQTAQKLVNELHQLGHKRIGFIGSDESNRPVRERLKGVRIAADINKMELREEHIIQLEECYRESLEKMYESPNPPTALIMVNDITAFSCFRDLDNMSIRIPDDISIMAFGDSEWSKFLRPSITGTIGDTNKVAQLALDILMQKMEEPDLTKKVIQTEVPQKIILRESIGKASPSNS